MNTARFFLSGFLSPSDHLDPELPPSTSCLALLPRCCIVVECFPPSHAVHRNRNSRLLIHARRHLRQNGPTTRTKRRCRPTAGLPPDGSRCHGNGRSIPSGLGGVGHRSLFVVYLILKHFIILIALKHLPPRRRQTNTTAGGLKAGEVTVVTMVTISCFSLCDN